MLYLYDLIYYFSGMSIAYDDLPVKSRGLRVKNQSLVGVDGIFYNRVCQTAYQKKLF